MSPTEIKEAQLLKTFKMLHTKCKPLQSRYTMAIQIYYGHVTRSLSREGEVVVVFLGLQFSEYPKMYSEPVDHKTEHFQPAVLSLIFTTSRS